MEHISPALDMDEFLDPESISADEISESLDLERRELCIRSADRLERIFKITRNINAALRYFTRTGGNLIFPDNIIGILDFDPGHPGHLILSRIRSIGSNYLAIEDIWASGGRPTFKVPRRDVYYALTAPGFLHHVEEGVFDLEGALPFQYVISDHLEQPLKDYDQGLKLGSRNSQGGSQSSSSTFDPSTYSATSGQGEGIFRSRSSHLPGPSLAARSRPTHSGIFGDSFPPPHDQAGVHGFQGGGSNAPWQSNSAHQPAYTRQPARVDFRGPCNAAILQPQDEQRQDPPPRTNPGWNPTQDADALQAGGLVRIFNCDGKPFDVMSKKHAVSFLVSSLPFHRMGADDRERELLSHDNTQVVPEDVLSALVRKADDILIAISVRRPFPPIWATTRLWPNVETFEIVRSPGRFAEFLSCAYSFTNPFKLVFFAPRGTPSPTETQYIVPLLTGLEHFLCFVCGPAFISIMSHSIARIHTGDFQQMNVDYALWELEHTLQSFFLQLRSREPVDAEGNGIHLRQQQAVAQFLHTSLAGCAPSNELQQIFFQRRKEAAKRSRGEEKPPATIKPPVKSGGPNTAKSAVSKGAPLSGTGPASPPPPPPSGITDFCRTHIAVVLAPNQKYPRCRYKKGCNREHYIPGKSSSASVKSWWAWQLSWYTLSTPAQHEKSDLLGKIIENLK